jgi:ATP-dependent DNA helicase PIF1
VAIGRDYSRQHISIIGERQHLPTELLLCPHVDLTERTILAPRNDTVDKLNAQLLTSMRGDPYASYSADKIVDQENTEHYASEYLNTINLYSLPPHELKLKVGAPVILLRNLSPSTRLCNGTRLKVIRISQRVIECEILAGKHAENTVLIPQIPLASSSTSDLPFDFQGTQFPLRLAFAMTINKAQGQTLKHVGLDLHEPVFTHGQLFVALSRVTDAANLKIIVPDTPEACREGNIKNVVYKEVFN